MKKILLLSIAVLYAFTTYAQYTITLSVKSSEEKIPLAGATATIIALNKTTVADSAGVATFTNIAAGTYQIKVSYVDLEEQQVTVEVPQPNNTALEVLLEEGEEHEEEIIITATRISRTIANIPTRVEVISGEELTEKGNMKPGDIRMLLNESTGIQTQQTSATSYNSSIRIQGLDGKYTQLLRDGMPLYAGFSGGLSLMQIAPLDLRQVEVIKGGASTLYGGGAIAGLVNLISKTPQDEPELSFMLNGTSALGLDASGFYSEKFGKIGTTIFASYNKGTPYDPADVGLTAIPKFDRFTLSPRVFIYPSEKTEISLGINFITEDRLGGNVAYIKGKDVPNAYFEENQTDRLTTQLEFMQRLTNNSQLTVKNSFNFYDRTILVPDFTFAGNQFSSFSELAYTTFNTNSEWIAGINLWTDQFDQSLGSPNQKLDFSNTTLGIFLQNTTTFSEQWALETGMRADYQSEHGFFPLPRLSLMFEPSEALTFRLGGGLGYKSPTIFSEETERLHFRNLLPINPEETEAERSIGGNFDINHRWDLTDELALSTNALFFYTELQNPLVLSQRNGIYQFLQPKGYIDTKGIEMNMKWSYRNLKFFIGYTYADVKEHYNGERTTFPLVARHRLNNVLMYEKHENFWVGLEAYYFSPQKLSDGSSGKAYWIMGLMTEKTLGDHISLFLNFENFLDARQTDFDILFTGSIDNPQFRDLYAPVDGFVMNGGVKIRL